jgi:ribose transport system substrate-binding protein
VNNRSIARLAGVSTLAVALSAVGCSKPSGGPSAGRPKLVMIPKATQASFWNAVRRGAEQAADQRKLDLTWKGPDRDNDRAGQKRVMQQFAGEGVDAILLAPTDSRALVPDAAAAMGQKIPVLIFDSALDGKVGQDYISYVATDNLAAGKLGGQHLMKLVGEGGKVILFRHMEGQQSTAEREDGALAEFDAAKAEILIKDRYTGQTADEAQRTALNMIDAIREADGIFASNQTSSEGLLVALKKNNLAGKIKFVGFDSSPMLVKGLADGEIHALVLQDPVTMGHTAVSLVADHLAGKPIDEHVSTECRLVTRDNMNDPEIKPLLQ